MFLCSCTHILVQFTLQDVLFQETKSYFPPFFYSQLAFSSQTVVPVSQLRLVLTAAGAVSYKGKLPCKSTHHRKGKLFFLMFKKSTKKNKLNFV